jgi:hypothetical protein
MPARSAAAYTNGLKVEPACRRLCVARFVLVVLEVPSPDHRANVAGLGLQRHDHALEIWAEGPRTGVRGGIGALVEILTIRLVV